MSAGGLSTKRLDRSHKIMAAHVERGEVPGIVTLVSRHGEVHVDTIGMKAVAGNEPMRRDTIFRIASMSKPIAAAAAMILVEECKLRLDEPVDRLLPELASRKVLKRIDGPLDDTVPANRPITLRDLLTFRMGFGIVSGPPDRYPIQKAAREQQLMAFGLPEPWTPHDPDEWMRRFATLPLMHQPGERWLYNTSFEVLSVLVARASGQSLASFLRERLFEPLGMNDTGFSVPPAKLYRLASCYQVNPETSSLELYDGVEDSRWRNPPAFPSCGGGLVSTIDDYLAFGQMMLNQGKHGNERILSRPSVEAMTTDQLTPEQKALSPRFIPEYWDTRGGGFGVSVVTKHDSLSATPGQFGWDGGFGTSWCSDPAEDMVAVLMSQRLGFPMVWPVNQDFWTSVYQAIDD